MKILAYAYYNSAVSYHRIIAPLMNMPNDVEVKIENQFNEEDYNGIDLLVYNRQLPEPVMEKVNELREKYGFKICVDIDDYWELDPHHILYQHYIDTGFAEKQIWHLKNADFITCTHDRLAELITSINKNVYILPNAILKQGQFDIERIASPFTRLFWQGTVTHEQDIELLRRPIEALKPIAGKIKMVLAGFEDDTVEKENTWDRMIGAYTSEGKHQYKLFPGSHVAEYYKAYAEADVCLIPLLNSPFNRNKSNLKVLEAANLGLPVICSHVHPYLDLPVFYAKNSTDWVTHINRLASSRKRQKEAGLKLQEFVNENFNFQKINKERKQIFEYSIKTIEA